MKKYRLKKEAVPFFNEKLATKICDIEKWQKLQVDEKALEEVEEARIEYGIRESDTCISLNGWDKNGTEMRFTLIFPSMKFKEHDDFTKGRMVRELMNRIQKEVNYLMEGFYNKEEKI